MSIEKDTKVSGNPELKIGDTVVRGHKKGKVIEIRDGMPVIEFGQVTRKRIDTGRATSRIETKTHLASKMPRGPLSKRV